MPKNETIVSALLVITLVTLSLSGGSARADTLGLILLFPVLVISSGICLLMLHRVDFATLRVPFALLAAFALSIAIQLVPLPPAITGGPGAADLQAAGNAGSWRAISASPDRTWHSLVSLIAPAWALLAYAVLRERRALIAVALVAIALVSAVLGVLQVASGANSPFHLYEFAHRGIPAGLLANRNHQAALLAAAIPLLRAWAIGAPHNRHSGLSRAVIAWGLAIFFATIILISGSRAGLLLLGIALIACVAIGPRVFPANYSLIRKWAVGAIGLVLLLTILLLTQYLGRARSLDRLTGIDVDGDLRMANTPALLSLLKDSLPFGSGFGSFDPVFRGVEPDLLLRTTYFNNAHNDLLELAITGGVPALLVLGAFLIWWASKSIRIFRTRMASTAVYMARAASIGILIFLLASLSDYPLRTPLLGAVFAFLCAILAQVRSLEKG